MLMKFKYLFMVAGLVFCLCQIASAELAAVGPVDSTGFPSWYKDENGLSLQLCLTAGVCVFDPASGTSFSVQIGFGEKAFYWSANAELTGTGAKGSLKMALVASFSGSTTGAIPANGEQITFFQIVVGPLTGLTAGDVYRVIHPYGVLENLVADSSGSIPIQRQDIGCAAAPCDFAAVLGSTVGPFLQWDTGAPAGFIGNPAIAHAVVGSPFGTNIFRVEGPNAGGTGVSFKETNLFKVQGKSSTGILPTPLVVDRATYTRDLPPQIEVLATSSLLASLRVSWTGGGPPVAMTTDGNGKFFARIFNPVLFPSSVTVTASELGKTNTTVVSGLVDIVAITLAEFNPVTTRLTIKASSSDRFARPTLTAVGFGNLIAGESVVLGLTVPPAEVTVISSAGGVATAPVSVIARPLAKNDSALTLRARDVPIDVIANDVAFPFCIGIACFNPETVSVVNGPDTPKGTTDRTAGIITYTPDPSKFTKPVETDTFKYTVKDLFGQESNEATVTVTVAEAETLTVTKAVFISRSKWWQISGKSTVKSGNKITLYVGTGTGGVKIAEDIPVNAFGGWTYSKPNSSVDPGGATSITAVSTLDTERTFPLTIK